ncbi:MAG TPA: diguanylate cyclase [Chloroflexaceae bacterium]|mgnify:CR=1 FL=1|nr:diguanylate cyclase [Chloroflexaceae bacterium]
MTATSTAMQIAIADDDAMTRRLLRALLTAAGHEVLEAGDGEAAWALLQREGVSLLITDWQMPRLDGPGLIRRIRTADLPGYIYTILLTSRDSKTDTVAGLEGGADDYLTKPFHAEELRARVAIGARILALEASLREARDGYAYQASHDPLTGLLNRLAITTHVRAELARASRGGHPLSLALLDIDHFKQVNDTHGHLVGDQALCHVAQTLTGAVRPYDWVGRWGGEEFLVILAGTGLDDALAAAERLRAEIEARPLRLADGAALSLTVSVGVACAGPAGEQPGDPVRLFQRADAALYEAKRMGRNRVCR